MSSAGRAKSGGQWRRHYDEGFTRIVGEPNLINRHWQERIRTCSTPVHIDNIARRRRENLWLREYCRAPAFPTFNRNVTAMKSRRLARGNMRTRRQTTIAGRAVVKCRGNIAAFFADIRALVGVVIHRRRKPGRTRRPAGPLQWIFTF